MLLLHRRMKVGRKQQGEKKEKVENNKEGCSSIRQRYVVTILLAFGILCNNMQRTCFYIALVDMTADVRTSLSDYAHIKQGSWERCPPFFFENLGSNEGMFKDWSDAVQGQLLASYSIGYSFTCLLGSYIAEKYGAKQIFGASVVLTSLCSILTPLVAWVEVGPYFVMAVRGIMGFAQGPMYPAATCMMTKWSPRNERAILCAVANSAVPLSIFLGNLLAGTIIAHLAWQWVFYIFSVFGFFWFVLWEAFVFSTPRTHKFITLAERAFIKYSIYYNSPEPKGEPPLLEILKSYRFHVVAYANFGFDWGFFIVSMELPFYLRNVLSFPIMKIGVASAMPWLGMWIGSLVFGCISQFLISEGIFRKVDMRKWMTLLSTIVPGALLIMASWATCSPVLVCLLFSLSMFYAGSVYSGVRLSIIDLSPNYSSLTMSLINTLGNMAGFLVPIIVHSRIHDGGTMMEWRVSFWIAIIFMICSTTPYLLFVTTRIQPWNAGSEEVAVTPSDKPYQPPYQQEPRRPKETTPVPSARVYIETSSDDEPKTYQSPKARQPRETKPVPSTRKSTSSSNEETETSSDEEPETYFPRFSWGAIPWLSTRKSIETSSKEEPKPHQPPKTNQPHKARQPQFSWLSTRKYIQTSSKEGPKTYQPPKAHQPWQPRGTIPGPSTRRSIETSSDEELYQPTKPEESFSDEDF